MSHSLESILTFKESRILRSPDLCELAFEDWRDFCKDNKLTIKVYLTNDENEYKQFFVEEGIEVIMLLGDNHHLHK